MDDNIVFVGVGFFAADAFFEEKEGESWTVGWAKKDQHQKQKKQKKKLTNNRGEREICTLLARKHMMRTETPRCVL